MLLQVENLKVNIETYYRNMNILKGLSLSLNKGESLAIVGESGSGKSMFAHSLLRLVPDNITFSGSIKLNGEEILNKSEAEMRKIRGGRISMIFQDPMTSLNPTMKIWKQIAEVLVVHKGISWSEAKIRAIDLLNRVKIPNPKERAEQYPHQLSGGMRQRVMIAIALACEPEILIADEPTTALDVTVQAQILDLIKEMQREMNMGVILITHDFGVVSRVADRVAVMYGGRILEEGTKERIFSNPSHPYTVALMRSVPTMETNLNSELYRIEGMPLRADEDTLGCPFAARCPKAFDKCKKMPQETRLDSVHSVKCWLWSKDE